jgi:hypothetical protein
LVTPTSADKAASEDFIPLPDDGMPIREFLDHMRAGRRVKFPNGPAVGYPPAIAARRRDAYDPAPTRDSGHAPRQGSNTRTRGGRRSTGTSPPDDEGESDPPGESTPPAERETAERRCSECPDDISHMRRDATVCRKSKCQKAAQRRKQAEKPFCLPERRGGTEHDRLWARLLPPEWPRIYLDGCRYINSYGEGGPLNPELGRHLDYDFDDAVDHATAKEFVSLDEFREDELVPVEDQGRAA